LYDLSGHVLLFDKVEDLQGRVVSPSWIKDTLEEIQRVSRDAEEKRLEFRKNYEKARTDLLIGILAGEMPKEAMPKKSKTEDRKMIVPTLENLWKLFNANKIYLEEDQIKIEESLLAGFTGIMNFSPVAEWRELLTTSPPDVESLLSKDNSFVQKAEALIALIEKVIPSQSGGIKLSLVNFVLPFLQYTQTGKQRDTKGYYQESLKKYFEAFSIYAGDISQVLEKLDQEAKLDKKDILQLKTILNNYRENLRREGFETPRHNLAQIQNAIELWSRIGGPEAAEKIRQLNKMKNDYEMVLRQALLNAQIAALKFYKTNPRDLSVTLSTNLILMGISLLSSLVSNVLSSKDNKMNIQHAAEDVAKGLVELNSLSMKKEAKAEPAFKTAIRNDDKKGVVIDVVTMTQDGRTGYATMTPSEFHEFFESLRQGMFSPDKNFTWTTTASNLAFSSNNPINFGNISQTISGRYATQADLGTIKDVQTALNIIHTWQVSQPQFTDQFALRGPDFQSLTFDLGRRDGMSQNAQNAQMTVNLSSGQGPENVSLALTDTQDGRTTTIIVQLDNQGNVVVGGGLRMGNIGIFANDRNFSFYWNQRFQEWEIRIRTDMDYREGRFTVNMESLKHSGNLTAGMGATLDNGSVIPYLKTQYLGPFGIGQVTGVLGYDTKSNKPVAQIGLQSTTGSYNPYLNINSQGDQGTALNAGLRKNMADGSYVNISGNVTESNRNFSLLWGNPLYSVTTNLNGNGMPNGGNITFHPFMWHNSRNTTDLSQREGLTLVKPEGEIIVAEGLGFFRDDLTRALNSSQIPFTTELKGIFTSDVEPELTQELKKFGIDKKEELVKFIAIKSAFDAGHGQRAGAERTFVNYAELLRYAAEARDLRTRAGLGVKDYLYPGLSSADVNLDIRKPLDSWTLSYYAALLKTQGSEKAREHLERSLRVRDALLVLFGGRFSPADERHVRILNLFTSSDKDAASIEDSLRGLDSEYLGIVKELAKQGRKGLDIDMTSAEGLDELFQWAREIRKLRDNGYSVVDAKQILKNTHFFVQQGKDRTRAIELAIEYHDLMFGQGQREYNDLSSVFEIKQIMDVFGLGFENVFDLASRMSYKLDRENLKSALNATIAYKTKPYYKHLLYQQVADNGFKTLMPYIEKVENMVNTAQIDLDFGAERDFRNLIYWARQLKATEGNKTFETRLQEAFMSLLKISQDK